ncbi:ABC transporter ATP-binding protein [Roseomonas sp. E05]|uniref:ABC transporter ATP-binding protein n=1 Tax=Roseomonas sp. E05 TaxID=3046310 RepID=UPI0024B95430|nr:ABC transporter ATP-binding protein [Roseomonas sp. E05]MDJ0388767.1 ABC transporter ATP-binding protein [Roseomonas sp. E05]
MTLRMAEPVSVSLDGVKKWYGSFAAVRDVSLAIAPGEIVSLLGPSGCGKTTTLRMIAGLETADEGEIRIAGQVVNDVAPWKRQIGMVFQNYALFPHMTVEENIAFGLQMQGMGRSGIARQVREAMAQVRLGGMEGRRPSQLSGGQRQRVALARAIVTRPRVLLLDEPLAALDRKLREQMQVEIRALQRDLGITTVFVTHDQEEALTLSDRVVVMEAGQIVQSGTPAEIYERPRSRFVSDFIGFTNAVAGTVEGIREGAMQVRLASGHVVPLEGAEAGFPAGHAVDLVIRPEKLRLSLAPEARPGDIPGTVRHVVYMGAVTYYHVEIGGGATLIAMMPNDADGSGPPGQGSRVGLSWRPGHMLVFPRAAAAA